MIVYRELSSLQKDLGVSVKTLYSVSHALDKHYHRKTLQKDNGETRTLYVPSDELKHIQRRIADVLLSRADISPYATAYRFGCVPSANALPHVGRPVLLKLDIRHFFDSIIYPAVKRSAFPADVYSEPIRILLSLLCTYKGVLPQGAPSSPAVSNLILKEFDNTVGPWCDRRGITYTRYCDDMTFSGDFDPAAVTDFVKTELLRRGFFLNEKKTKTVRNGQRKTVTGYVVNEKLNAPADYRRRLRQEMHYCMKYGLASHLERIGSDASPGKYAASLLGRVNFVLSADPRSGEFLAYRAWLADAVRSLPSAGADDAVKPAERGSGSTVRVPYFGSVDIGACPASLDPEGMDGPLFPDQEALTRFIANNFLVLRKSGKNCAVCRGENSLAAVILIVDGILRMNFFKSAANLLCEGGGFWHTVSGKTLGSDIRKGFPPFYPLMLDIFKQHKLLFTNVSADGDAPAAVVIPDYDKLISGWLPRSCRREVLQRGIGLLAGEKNGMILELLYHVELSDGDRVLGRIVNYKNGYFTLQRSGGRTLNVPVENCGSYSASSDTDPDVDYFF